jgi:predicted Zn-dependent peptidase
MFFKKSISDSGVIVLSEPMANVRSVALGIWLGIGSRDESESLNGMSHFIEHLLFKGTKKKSAQYISETFDSLGGELNGFTSKEVTCFYTRLLDEHLPVGLEILTDMVQNPAFKDADLKAEKQVVLEEINLHNDTPDDLIHDLFSETLFERHPLGKPVLGRTETVTNFSKEDVVKFFEKAYSPQNLVIAASGNVDHDKLLSDVNKFYTKTGGTKHVRKSFIPEIEPRLEVLRRENDQAYICLGSKGLCSKDKDRFGLSVMDNLLGGGMSSRLFQEVREKKGLAYSVFSYHSVHSETGSMVLYAGTTPKKAKEVVKVFENEINKLKTESVKSKELNRAKQHLKGQLVLGLESTSQRMMRLGKSEISHGQILSVDELIRQIDKVTSNDIKRIANKIFDDDKMVLTVIGPFKTDEFER